MPERAIGSIIEEQQPVSAQSDTTVAEAARIMRSRRVGALLVMEGARLAGIFTERDALFRVLAEGRDAATTPLGEVMTRDPRTISPDRPFGHALHIMHEGGFRHVPVVREGRVVGVVSARDALAPEMRQFISDLEVRARVGEILG
jgi:CBS domain-containing protein